MIRFNNDYNRGAYPEILEALAKINDTAYPGYGTDIWCKKAAKEIQKYLKQPRADIHFIVGGTQTNFIAAAAVLRPYESMIAADSGHVSVHEAGAIENTGHKVETLPSENGKIRAAQIEALAESYKTSPVQEHITRPRMVYISFPTEYGTLYSKKELEDIRKVCDKYDLYFYIDGARLGYGLNSPECDVTLEDIGRLADAFYIGGTKCGALFGEAVVLKRKEFKDHFRSYMKQDGAILAKGWLLGVQFYEMFKDGLYFSRTKSAVDYALEIKAVCDSLGYKSYIESPTNQQFIIMENSKIEKLAESVFFEPEGAIDETHSCIRFCTSWATKRSEADALIAAIKAL